MEVIMNRGMKYGFKTMYIVHEAMEALVCFLYLCSHVYSTI